MNNPVSLHKPFYFDDAIWGADTWPLLNAAYTGDTGTVAQMLEEDSKRVRLQFAYYEPLHYAVRGGNIEMVKLLLQYGAHPKAPGWQWLGDETPIAKAIDRGFLEIAELLEKAAENMPAYSWPVTPVKNKEEQLLLDFELACGYNPDLTLVKSVLAARPEWATRGLYEAIHHNQMEIVKLLVAAQGDVNGFMPFACWLTPLMHTTRSKEPRWAMAEFLLENGVPVNGTNGLGMSALHIVVFYGIPEAAKWLLERGANINSMEPEFCSTPLGWAAKWGRSEMVKVLLEYGADHSLPQDIPWAQPRNWAKQKNHNSLFQMLNH